MAGHSVESLLAWMKDVSRLYGWDTVIALEGDRVNQSLHNTYLVKLSQGVNQPMPNRSISLPEFPEISYHFDGCVLGSPLLAWGAETSIERSDLTLHVPLVSGLQTLVKTDLGGSHVLRLSAYAPLNAPHLSLQLQPDTRPPAVALDLADSQDVSLVFNGTPIEQRELGKLFGAWLSDPANQGQRYPIGTFNARGNPLLLVRRVDVRVQREGDARPGSLAEKSALLMFVTMQHGATGGFPDEQADFRYLIPNDTDQPWSATAVFGQHLVHRAALGHAVLQLLEEGEFDFSDAPAEPTRHMTARAGSFAVPAASRVGSDYVFESEPFSLAATGVAQPLTVQFEPDKALQSWQFPCTVALRYKPVGSATWRSHTATFDVSLKHEFHLIADESGARAMEGHFFTPYTHTEEVTAVSGLPGNLEPAELEQINGYISYAIKAALLERLSQTLNVTETDSFLQDWGLGHDLGERGYEWGFEPLRMALPFDLAVFGRIQPAQAPFTIAEQGVVLSAADRLQFTTEPFRAGLNWSLESLPGSIGDDGRIDDNEAGAEYRAPPAHAMTQAVQRVLVIATDPDSNERSAALVTIQAYPISINPLIAVCDYGEQVPLSASGTGEGELEWVIKDRVDGESGELIVDPAGDHLYVAGPKVEGKTYVLDEIQASQAGKVRSAYVLVVQKHVYVTIKPLPDDALPEGQIRLQAWFDDEVVETTEWTLAAGSPGEIEEGVYDPGTLGGQQFALIFVLAEGRFEGHVILPLPLSNSPEVVQALAR